MLLGPSGEQSAHAADARPCTGEVALGPPLLGASQRLLNRDHFAVYYEVIAISLWLFLRSSRSLVCCVHFCCCL